MGYDVSVRYIILFTEFPWVMRLSWFPYLLFQLCQESCPVCWIRDALLARFSKALVVRGRRFSAFASVVGMTWRKFRHFLCHIGAFWLFLVRFPFYLTLFPPARAFFINVMVYHMTEPKAQRSRFVCSVFELFSASLHNKI